MSRIRYLMARLALVVSIALLALAMATPAKALSSTRATRLCNERIYILGITLLPPNTICFPPR